MLGVDQPDFGFLTDAMRVQNRSTFSIEGSLIQPRAEAEIAFFLKEDLLDQKDLLLKKKQFLLQL